MAVMVVMRIGSMVQGSLRLFAIVVEAVPSWIGEIRLALYASTMNSQCQE